MNNPVTIVAVGAGLGYGNLGYTHHAVEDIAIMRALPNLSIYSPADSTEVRKCLSHILQNNSPAYMRLGKGGEPAIHSGDLSSVGDPIQITKGNNGFIAFTGGVGSRVLEAEKLLNSEGFYPTIFSNPRLSTESIKSLINSARDSFLLTVEEHSLKGGFGSWLLEAKSDLNSNVKISRLGLDQENISLLGSQAYLLDSAKLTARDIADKFIALAKQS
jgi:transketolase